MLFVLYCFLIFPNVINNNRSHFFYVTVDLTEKNLLQAIRIPFDDPETVFFDSGVDSFPAMGIRRGSDIKSPFRLYLPEKFYPEFSITVTCKLASKEGGFLFAVVNPLDTVSHDAYY